MISAHSETSLGSSAVNCDRRNPDRPLLTVCLWDINPPDSRWHVLTFVDLLQNRRKKPAQILASFFDAHPIDACCTRTRSLFQTFIDELVGQMVKQIVELFLRMTPGLSCYRCSPGDRITPYADTGFIAGIDIDLHNLGIKVANADKRINRNEKIPAAEKVVSLSDQDAAMIVKGERETVVGYKPQLGRSKNGLITALIVPEGNAADSAQLRPTVDASIRRTGVIPSVLSFDDGYTNTKDRDYYLGQGVDVVSFSGAKGRNIIPAAFLCLPQFLCRERSRVPEQGVQLHLVLKRRNPVPPNEAAPTARLLRKIPISFLTR